MANTIINTRRLNWFRLGFLIEDEMKVEMLDRLHCYATSIWLRAIMQLLRNDGSMPERTLLASLSTRHISRPKIREILESTGDFVLNKANGHIVLSETILQQILPDTKRMNASNNEDQPAAKTQESSTPIENRPSNHDRMGKNETKNARQTTISSEKCPPNDDFAGKNEMKQGSKTDLDNNVRPNIESKRKNKKENKNISVSVVSETPTTPTEPERETKAAIDKGKKAASESRVSPEEADFNRQMKEHYPRVSSMKKPLTWDQYRKLKEKYSVEEIGHTLKCMENRANLNTRYVSAYLTILNWIHYEQRRQKG